MIDATPAQMVDLMVGRSVAELYPRSERTPGEELLSIEDLAGAMKPRSASLSVRRGEVLGIAGLVGAGRTELLRSIFGLDPIRSGRIRLGSLVGPASPARRWAQGAGLVSEDRKGEGLFLGLSIADNLTMSRLPALVLPARQAEAAGRWVERLAVRCRGPAQPVGALSGGNQQKVAVARLLHHDVDLFLLDEPTRGIDVASKAEIYRLIDDLVSRSDPRRGVILVSSYLPELLGICDRVAVMCRGKLGPAQPVEGLDERSLLMEATGQEGAA
jgi:ribose transport system ATP-binding protein